MKKKKVTAKNTKMKKAGAAPAETGAWTLLQAFFYAFSIAIATAAVIFCVLKFVNPAEKGGDDMATDEESHIVAMRAAMSQSADVVAITNSRVAYAINEGGVKPPFAQQLLSPDPSKSFLLLYLPGGYPRAFRFLFDRSGYKCLKSGGTVVYFPTPMEFNRNGKFFRLTVHAYYTWKEVLTELVPNFRFGNIKAYLTRGLDYLGKYNKYMKEKLFEKMADKAVPESNSLNFFKNDYYWKYNMDPYQIDSVNKMIDGVRRAGGKFILVMPPLSGSLREMLGKKHLDQFIAVIKDIAAKKNVPLIDYLSGFNGDEYSYMDGSHFDGSGLRFISTLIKDLQPLLGFSGPVQPAKPAR